MKIKKPSADQTKSVAPEQKKKKRGTKHELGFDRRHEGTITAEEIERRQKQIEREINSTVVEPFSHEAFRVDSLERYLVKKAKIGWKNGMKSYYGTEWKRHNNIPTAMIVGWSS